MTRRQIRAALWIVLVIVGVVMVSATLAGCAQGPTPLEIERASQLQTEIDTLRNEIRMQPMLPPETVEAKEAEIAEKQDERDELLESDPADLNQVGAAIIPWIPPPFNAIVAALIGVSPLLIKRKDPV